MKPVTLLCVLAALALSGCGTLDVDVTSWERSTMLPNARKVPGVRLSAQLLSHSDSAIFLSTTYVIPSEKIFRAVFTGNEDAPASLDLVEAKLTSNGFNLSERLVVTYEIETILRVGAARHTLRAKAEGRGASFDSQMRNAIEQATLDLARQCEAILAKH